MVLSQPAARPVGDYTASKPVPPAGPGGGGRCESRPEHAGADHGSAEVANTAPCPRRRAGRVRPWAHSRRGCRKTRSAAGEAPGTPPPRSALAASRSVVRCRCIPYSSRPPARRARAAKPLVLGRAHPRGVHVESAALHALEEGLCELGVQGVRLGHDCLGVVRDDDLEDASEMRPGRLTRLTRLTRRHAAGGQGGERF